MLLLGARSEIVVSGPIDARIDRILTLQRGRVARAQLLRAGVSDPAIRRRLARGRLLTVHRAVYRAAGQIDVPLADETAALLALRDGALLSHGTAARLWGLTATDGVHATVVGSPAARLNGVTVHRAARLDPKDIRSRHGLPVTSPAHTVLDIAPGTPLGVLENVIATGIDRHVMRQRDVQDVLNRHPHHPGAPKLRRLLDAPPILTRSEAERIFLGLVRQAQLPMPTVNRRRGSVEPDFFWPEQRLIVEIDGYEFHGGHTAFQADRKRDQLHAAQGLRTIRFTYRQLVDEPMVVIALLGAALNAAG